jgi:hypothetical protein
MLFLYMTEVYFYGPKKARLYWLEQLLMKKYGEQ